MVDSNGFSAEDILEFSQDKFERKRRKFNHKPTYITWEITNDCNLRCKHCALAEAGKPLKDELNTKEAFEVIENIADSGAKEILISGGEPLVRGDILEITNHASRFLSVSLQTNGYLLEEYAHELKGIGLEQIQISLDGLNARSHDFLRGKGSFEKAIRGIKKCQELDFKLVSVAAVIHQSNLKELPDMIDMMLEMKVDFFEVRALAPFGKAQNLAKLALTIEQRKKLYEYVAKKQQELRIIGSEDPYIYMLNREMLDECLDISNQTACLGCAAGIVGCTIKPNGKIVPCSGVKVEVGDIRTEKLIDIWKNSHIFQLLRDRNNLKGKCGICEYKYICGGCRGAATELSGGDVMAEDPMCWFEPTLES